MSSHLGPCLDFRRKHAAQILRGEVFWSCNCFDVEGVGTGTPLVVTVPTDTGVVHYGATQEVSYERKASADGP